MEAEKDNPQPISPPKHLTQKDAAAYIGVGIDLMRKMRRCGVGPGFITIPTSGRPRYPIAELDRFLQTENRAS